MSISYHYETDVVRLIKNYLQQHPHSEDTIVGITQWWVKQQQFADSMVAVDNALKVLALQGEVDSVKRNDETYYRLTKKSVIF
ncbi:MAG: hypothetical protein MJK04_02485, partial [Psychrosphaera sp.]|nr:hypothetical protein [Psychrosphaera sp.]